MILNLIRKIIEPSIRNNLKLFNFIAIIRYYSGYPIYILQRYFFKLEYIGGYLFSDQEAGRSRQKIIAQIASKIIKKKIQVLEIGVYCGQTTLCIAKTLKERKKKFKITCVDIWDEFFNTLKKNSFIHNKMINDLKSQKVYNLFLHNLKVNNLQNDCNILKQTSNFFFKQNKKKFDLIIIDGSHLYSNVINDIKNSKKYLNNNGLIIGDDYEINFSNVSHINFNNKKKIDVFFDNKSKTRFHPGVTLSVYNEFGDLKSKNGLFCVKKKKK